MFLDFSLGKIFSKIIIVVRGIITSRQNIFIRIIKFEI